jgi:hypothetical protein
VSFSKEEVKLLSSMPYGLEGSSSWKQKNAKTTLVTMAAMEDMEVVTG